MIQVIKKLLHSLRNVVDLFIIKLSRKDHNLPDRISLIY